MKSGRLANFRKAKRILSSLGLFVSCAVLGSDPTGVLKGRQIGDGFYQLTGTQLKVHQTEFEIPELADPAPPYVNELGEVEIYGSARYYIRYPNWAEFEKGGQYEQVPLKLLSADAKTNVGQYAQPWDMRKYRLQESGHASILVGGTMTPSSGRDVASWPDDNFSRRIYSFKSLTDGSWLQDLKPLVGDISTGWLGHSYGGNFFQPEMATTNTLNLNKDLYLFYEKVSEVRNNFPAKTEIFVSKMRAPNGNFIAADETKLLAIGANHFPSTQRSIGGFLMEGPRPIQMTIKGQIFYIITFSSGDFCTDAYTMSYAWSRNLLGPYNFALNNSSTDLLDIGKKLKTNYDLSWVGRPAIYTTEKGDYEILFHGVDKSILPDHDYTRWPESTGPQLWNFFRILFKARLNTTLLADGSPSLSLDLH